MRSKLFFSNKKTKAFTLIELLVVMAIIGNLSVIFIVNLQDVRAKARDAIRMHDFDVFSTGLNVYYSTYEAFPCGTADAADVSPGRGMVDSTGSCPSDPLSDGPGFLNGPDSIAVPTFCAGPAISHKGLFKEGILYNNCPKDPRNTADTQIPNQVNYRYWYVVSADRQSYVLATYLERNKSKMANDGGLCRCYYEVLGGKKEISNLGFHANTDLGYGCNGCPL